MKNKFARMTVLFLLCVALLCAGFAAGYALAYDAKAKPASAAPTGDDVARLKAALIWDPGDLSTYIGPNMVEKDGRYYPKEGVVTSDPYDTALSELRERKCFVPVFSYFTKGYQEVSAKVFTEKLGQSLAFYFDDMEAKDGKIRRISMAFSQYAISTTAKDFFYLQHNGGEYLIALSPKPDGTGTMYTINFFLGADCAYPYVYIGSDYLINGIPELLKIVENMTIENLGGGLPTAP